MCYRAQLSALGQCRDEESLAPFAQQAFRDRLDSESVSIRLDDGRTFRGRGA
jgi:hypothetical protein